MQYVSRETGEPITELEDLRQSLVDIITTPKGTRIKLRDYGSLVPRMIDRPTDSTFPIELYSAIAEAIDLYEPRLLLTRVSLSPESSSPQSGVVAVDIAGVYLPTGRQLVLDSVKLYDEAQHG